MGKNPTDDEAQIFRGIEDMSVMMVVTIFSDVSGGANEEVDNEALVSSGGMCFGHTDGKATSTRSSLNTL